MKIKRLFFLAAVLVLCAPAASWAQAKRGAKGKAKPKATQPAGPAIEVKYIGNDELKQLLTRNAGQKPLLVNFWATWCEPCVEEFPDLVKIDQDYKARGLEFITISLDEKEELTKGVPKFLKRMNSTMPAFLLNPDNQEEAFNIIGSKQAGLPITLLYNSDGKVAFMYEGKLKINQLRADIETLLPKQ